MKGSTLLILVCLATTLAATARGGEVADDLPSPDIAVRSIRAAAVVAVARAQLEAAGAERDRLWAGPHEFNLRAELQQRQTSGEGPDQTFREWRLALERPLRLPGKAALDQRLGEEGVAAARVNLDDGLHESARLLLDLWFDWLKAVAAARLWQDQLALLQREAELVHRRQVLGDAARLDVLQARAAAGQARHAAGQAATRLAVARAGLVQRFDIPLPARVPEREPLPLAGGEAEWLQRILDHSHELAHARARSELASLQAARARVDVLPDPTLGVWMASERAGEERLLGLSVAMPIPGSARGAEARMAAADAAAVRAMEEGVRQKVRAEALSLIATARASFEQWRDAEAAARDTGDAASMLARAHQLGEAALSDVLRARGLANEARLAEADARLDARRDHFRLLVDTHALWDMDRQAP